MFQYIEFLRIQLASRSVSDYEKALPPMEFMWEQYQNDPAIVFQVWGPLFSASVRPALKIGDDGEVKIDRNLASAALPSLTDKCVESAMQVKDPLSTDVANQQCIDQGSFCLQRRSCPDKHASLSGQWQVYIQRKLRILLT